MKSWIRLCRKLNIWILSILMLLFNPLCAAFASEVVTEQETFDTELPAYPYLSIEIRIVGEPNEDGSYMQNWDEKARYPIADMTELQYEIYISNEGSVQLEEPFEEVWIGDWHSTSVYSDDTRTYANKQWKSRGGTITVSDQDVERGYMVLRARYTATCPDTAYAKNVEAEQEITIKVCPRPEKDIVAFLETWGGSEVSDQQRAEVLKGFFGSRYEEMKARVMAEEQPDREMETESVSEAVSGSSAESRDETETTQKTEDNNRKPYIISIVIFFTVAAGVSVAAVMIYIRRRKKK